MYSEKKVKTRNSVFYWKILAVIVCCGLLLLASACGSEKHPEASGNTNTDGEKNENTTIIQESSTENTSAEMQQQQEGDDYTSVDDFDYYVRDDGKIVIEQYKGTDSEVYIPKTIKEKQVVKLTGTFCQNETITKVVIPDGVEELESYALSGCTNLTDIEIPDSVTTITSNVFSATAWLENQPDGIVYAGRVAYTYKTDEPILDATVIELKDGTLGIAGGAFQSVNVSELKIPDSVISVGGTIVPVNCAWYENQSQLQQDESWKLIYVGKVAYQFLEKYTGHSTNIEVTIDEGTKGIATGCFNTYDDVYSVNMPDSLEFIGEAAFSRTSLSNVVIPNGVIHIGHAAFSLCHNLVNIVIPESVVSMGDASFDEGGNICIAGTSGSLAENVAEKLHLNFMEL